jgi:hypothetical protein
MARNERRTARKPATKFPNLRKKLLKGKIQAKQAKKSEKKTCPWAASSVTRASCGPR